MGSEMCIRDRCYYRQHIYGSYFLIHLATLCLLIGTFKPFTFKVITDRYIVVAIFTFISMFFLPLLFLKEGPLIFLIILVWW